MPELFGFLTPNCTWVIPLQKTAILKKQTRSFFWAKIESLDMLYTWKFFNFEIRVSLLQELRWSVSIIDWGWNVTPIPKEWAQMDFSSLILPHMGDFPTCHFQITVTSAGLYMQEQEKTRFNFACNMDKNFKPSVSRQHCAWHCVTWQKLTLRWPGTERSRMTTLIECFGTLFAVLVFKLNILRLKGIKERIKD